MCLKESCFSDCWKVSLMVHVLKNVKKRSWAKNYCSVSLLSVVSKVFEKFVNKRLVDTPKKYGLFSDFQYDFRSSWSIANLRIAASDRIVRTFNRSGATWAVALDISKAFGRVWHFGLVHKFKSFGISRQILYLISPFLCKKWIWVVPDGKSSREYPVNSGVPQNSILGSTLFTLNINDLHDNIICNIAIYADDTTPLKVWSGI